MNAWLAANLERAVSRIVKDGLSQRPNASRASLVERVAAKLGISAAALAAAAKLLAALTALIVSAKRLYKELVRLRRTWTVASIPA